MSLSFRVSNARHAVPLIDQVVTSIGAFLASIMVAKVTGLEGLAVYASLQIFSFFGVQVNNDSSCAFYAARGKSSGSYRRDDRSFLVIISILVSTATALVGSIVVAATYEVQKLQFAHAFVFIFLLVLTEQSRRYLILSSQNVSVLLLGITRHIISLGWLTFMLKSNEQSISMVLYGFSFSLFIALCFLIPKVSTRYPFTFTESGFFVRFGLEIRFIVGSGIIKYFNNQGFHILLMTVCSPLQFGFINFLLTLFKPVHVILLPYENYLVKVLDLEQPNKVFTAYVMFFSSFILLLVGCLLVVTVGSGYVSRFLLPEYEVNFFLTACFGSLFFLRCIALLLRVRLRLVGRTPIIFASVILSSLVPTSFWIASLVTFVQPNVVVFGLTTAALVNVIALSVGTFRSFSQDEGSEKAKYIS